MTDSKIIDLWNSHCEDAENFTGMVYPNDDDAFDTFGFTINGTLLNNHNEVYDWEHEWVTSDEYGNPMSSDDPKDLMDKEFVNKLVKS